MRIWSRLRSWFRTAVYRSGFEREMDAELRSHLDAYADDLVRGGLSQSEARRRAQLEFGGIDAAKEECRQARGARFVDTLSQDLRYGLRVMGKNPAFTIVAVLTLALGIGASTAIFGVVESVLVEPFPYPDAGRLMTVEIHDAGQNQPTGRPVYPGPEFLDYVEKNHVFDRVIGNDELEVIYSPGDSAEGMWRYRGILVIPGTFEFFGMPSLLGRVMGPADYEPGAPPVFVLRYRTWVRDFAADPAVVNKTFVLNGVARTLIGIMPPRFAWGNGDVFIPEKPVRSDAPVAGQVSRVWYMVGHLKPGVSITQAQADLTVVASQLAKVYPRNYPEHFRVEVVSLTDMVVGHFRRTLYITLAAVALLLLIGCANVANLMLARATTREKEFALRSALGASRSRLVRQLLIESLLLAIGGAALGVVLAWAGLKGLVALLPQQSIPAETVVRLSTPVLVFAVTIGLLTPLIFGLAPALRAVGGDLEKPLRDTGKGATGGAKHGRLRDLVIVAEVALSFTLLAGAGLLIRSFVALRNVDLGLRPDHVLVSRLVLPADRYKNAAQVTSFFQPLIARLKALPGVLDAAESNAIPPDGGSSGPIEIPGRAHSEQWNAAVELCSEGYFPVLRLKLLEGRVLSEAEVTNARKVAVVNKTFAGRYLPGVNPLGQRVRVSDLENGPDGVPDPQFEIVGVVADARNRGLQQPAEPEVWVPCTVTGSGGWGILVRTANDPTSVMNEVRNAVWATDRGVAIGYTDTLENYINQQSYAGPRFGFILMSIFGGTGLILATIGVYSVVAYATARRQHEFGIRMAIGATLGDVLRLVLGQGAKLAFFGVLLGIPIAVALARMMQGLLFSVSATDPLTLAGVALLLMGVGIFACYIPARKAMRVDPMEALRCE
jgi:putative ABC transport system permease protein